jgi:hypothetical protein
MKKYRSCECTRTMPHHWMEVIRFMLRPLNPGTHLTAWAGPTTGMYVVTNTASLLSTEINRCRQAPQLITSLTDIYPSYGTTVNLFLSLIKHYATNTYGEVEVLLHTFVTLTLDRGERPVSHSSCFTLKEIVPGTQ